MLAAGLISTVVSEVQWGLGKLSSQMGGGGGDLSLWHFWRAWVGEADGYSGTYFEAPAQLMYDPIWLQESSAARSSFGLSVLIAACRP